MNGLFVPMRLPVVLFCRLRPASLLALNAPFVARRNPTITREFI